MTEKKSKFKPMAFGFHEHSHYSIDGSSTPKQKLQRAQELGRPADCLTDHGNMSGLIPHYLAAQDLSKKGPKIQSIHGIELYVVDERRPATVYKNGNKIGEVSEDDSCRLGWNWSIESD